MRLTKREAFKELLDGKHYCSDCKFLLDPGWHEHNGRRFTRNVNLSWCATGDGGECQAMWYCDLCRKHTLTESRLTT
jgi:hypothetical protein